MNSYSEMTDAPVQTASAPTRSLLSYRALVFVLALWLGGSALLDFVVMPTFYFTGMMASARFASASESLFLTFNNLEIILGAIVIAVRAQCQKSHGGFYRRLGVLGLPMVMLTVALLYRYLLTPQMAGMGVSLDWMSESTIPTGMMMMHAAYWLLEGGKLMAGVVLLNRCFSTPI
jgi:hypothetical protein